MRVLVRCVYCGEWHVLGHEEWSKIICVNCGAEIENPIMAEVKA